jgi:hypothetical protein
MMQPLRVIAHMWTGTVVTSDKVLGLDGILAFAWMVENRPEIYFSGSNSHPIDTGIPLPLGHKERAGQWYYAASAGCFKELAGHLMYVHRRFDLVHSYYLRTTTKVVTHVGPGKTVRLPQVGMVVPSITWYCVGDAEEIERLLTTYIDCVGRAVGIGQGWVDHWTVEPWPHDWSETGPNGEVMRPLPLDGQTGGRVALYGIRPPAWYMPNRVTCVMPGDERHALSA